VEKNTLEADHTSNFSILTAVNAEGRFKIKQIKNIKNNHKNFVEDNQVSAFTNLSRRSARSHKKTTTKNIKFVSKMLQNTQTNPEQYF
jgi:hypothetical protein